MSAVILRPSQIAAADAVEDAYRRGVMRPLVDKCVGSGKSLSMAELARRAWVRGERSIILAHRQELVVQNAKACRLLGLDCGINASKLGERTWRGPVISAMINSVYNKPQNFGPIVNILTDECFPAGTLVATPAGDVRIEDIVAGETVNHALGTGHVEATSSRAVSELVEVRFDDGSSIRCTENHPLFTLQGWQVASRLETGSRVVREQGVRELRNGFHPDTSEWARSERTSLEQDAFLLDILFQESRELYARPCNTGTDGYDNSSDRAQTDGSRRQRTRDDERTGRPDRSTWARVGTGIGRSDSEREMERISVALQNRHSEPNIADCNRGGRSVTQREASFARRQKGCPAAFARVVSVSRIKCASPCTVYNLQVAGHPSYFANGLLVHNCHLIPHSESGMYREFHRYFPHARRPGFSGTVFRLQGGSLVEGEAAPFDEVVYRYTIIDGIRDGYLVPAFSAPAQDKIDPSKLKRNGGEYTGSSQDAQTIDLMDSHIAQMKTLGADRRAWLIFEASQKAALAMTERLNAWGIPAGCIIDKTPNREQLIADFAAGRLRALVNVEALTVGFDDPRIDLVCMRRKTKSLGLYIQIAGRGLRTIAGNIEASMAAGKSDCLFFDFAGNIDEHGPLDFIRPKDTKISMVSCEECGARNARAAMRCWSCDALMTKLCPACLQTVDKGVLDCPHCNHDMRVGGEPGEPRKVNLLETPSGAALISSLTPASEREGGWLPIRKVWEKDGITTALDENGGTWELSPHLAPHAADARWVRSDASGISVLKPNGRSRNTVIQVSPNGFALAIPMPPQVIC